MLLNGGLKSSQVNFFPLSQDKYSEFAFELLFFHVLEFRAQWSQNYFNEIILDPVIL